MIVTELNKDSDLDLVVLFAEYLNRNIHKRWANKNASLFKNNSAVNRFISKSNLNVCNLASCTLYKAKTYGGRTVDSFISKLWKDFNECRIPQWISSCLLGCFERFCGGPLKFIYDKEIERRMNDLEPFSGKIHIMEKIVAMLVRTCTNFS